MSSEMARGLWVAFERDITTEGAEMLANAIRMMKYVSDVSFDDCIVEHDDWMEREQLRSDVADVTTTVLRALLTRDQCLYVPERTKDKIVIELEKIVSRLREKK